jgi:hypothetical protein
MHHDGLIRTLMEHLQSQGPPPWCVVCEQTLGPTWVRNHPGRADVVAIKVSWARPCIRIYEVKASRADLRSDLTSGKWMKYLDDCNQFYFATPKGLVKKGELPENAGLIVRSEKGWRCQRHPTMRSQDPTPTFLLAMLFAKHHEREPVGERAKRIAKWRAELREEGRDLARSLRRIGQHEAAEALEQQRFWKERRRMQDEERRDLAAILIEAGLPTNPWELRRALEDLRKQRPVPTNLKFAPEQLRKVADELEAVLPDEKTNLRLPRRTS